MFPKEMFCRKNWSLQINQELVDWSVSWLVGLFVRYEHKGQLTVTNWAPSVREGNYGKAKVWGRILCVIYRPWLNESEGRQEIHNSL
jgi:hypothetical protein